MALLALSAALAVPTTAQAQADPPTLNRAAVSSGGSSINIVLTENLDQVHLSLPSAVQNAFSVTVDGVASGIASGGTNLANRLSLMMSSTIYQGQTVVLSYDKTVAGSDALADSDGDEVASFTTGEDGVPAVVNNSGVMAPPNNSPVFATNLAVFTLPENSAANVVVGTVMATDEDDDTLTYSLEGTDAASFDIDSGTGEIKTRSGVTYNYETKFTYEMTAKAEDGNGGSDTIDVRIALLDDQTEKSAKPAKPTLVSVPGLFTSLAARWTKPGLNGGPDIIGYEVQYRQGTGGSWMNFTHSGAAPTTTITGLTADTSYQVRVRAWNGGALSDWSDASDPVSTGEAPPPPTVTSVVVASAPHSGNTYHWGETIVFTVTFSEPVRVTGRPELEVGLDNPAGTSGSTVQARFAGLSENGRPGPGARPVPVSRYVLFAYTVQPFDRDTDGVRIGDDALRLAAGDRIQSEKTDVDAEFDHAALGAQSGHRVDGRTGMDGEPAAPVAGAGITFVDGNGDPLETRADGNHRLSVPEGGSARYGLRLKTRPAKNVVLSFHPQSGDADLDVPRNYSSDRSIGPDEWDTRTVWVRVEAAQDADAANGERVFAHNTASNDPSYHHLVLPDVVAVEADDDEPTCTLSPGDLWCGVVTVGSGSDYFGYDFQTTPEVGALSDDDFDVGTNSYTIFAIVVSSQTAQHPGSLGLSFSPSTRPTAADREKLVLHVGSAEYRLSQAFFTAGRAFRWNDAGLDWSGQNYVILRLRDTSSAQRALQGRFVSPPGRHDGKKRIKVQVAFSEAPENVGADGVEVEGGAVTSVSPVGGDAPGGAGTRKGTRSAGGRNAGQQDREVVWEIEIEPDSDGDVTVSIEAGRPCDEEGAICTADGRSLSEDISTTVEGPEEGPPPLTASFESMPEAHDGESGFTFRIAFSERVGWMNGRRLREDVVAVSGGRATAAGRVDRRRDLWQVTVEPDSTADVTVTLEAGAACRTPAAVCTSDGRALSATISATVAGPAQETAEVPLTASFEAVPGEHDGESAFRFRLAFSEPIAISYRSLREDAFAVTGGRVTRGKRVDGRKDLFEITVEPDGGGEVAVSLPAGRECEVSGAICTWGPPRKQLTNTPSATVAGPDMAPANTPAEGAPAIAGEAHVGGTLTASTSGITDADGLENATFAYQWIRGGAEIPGATGSDYTAVDADEGERLQVRVGFADDAGNAESLTSAATERVVARPLPKVLAADARAREGEDATLGFAVTLSAPAPGPVTVDYATLDASATAGEDYEARSGTLSFAPGETAKTVAVPVLDDAVDEGTEILVLRLENVRGAVLADRLAVGRIENSDPLQKMWLSRFGRTVAGQVVDAVAGRLSGPAGGSRVTLGGRSIDLSSQSAGTADARRTLAGALGAAEDDDPLAGPGPLEAARAGSWADPETGGSARGLTGRELLLGSSFHLAAGGGEAGGPGYAAWGRVAVGGFDAEAPADNGTLHLDGEVTTGILGADAEWERWLAGVALSVSNAEGTFDQPGVDSGTVESTLTSVNPYVRYEASDRLSVWGLLGYGTGDMTIRGNSPVRTDLMLRLGAAGARGVLLEAGEDGGIDLALRGDAFLVQMESEAAANTVETKADASRLRLVLEAGRSFALGEGAVLTPALELGLRHDGGDAETGTGVEVGGRIRYTDAGSGLTVEANARTLIAHEDSGYREWGAGGSVRLDPGASGRGLSLTIAPVWGTPSSGVDRLWSARDAAGLAPGGEFEAESRLEGEVGYGLGAFGGHGVVTPYAGLGLAEAGDRTWRAGARWSLAPHLAMSLDGARREMANDDAPEHGVRFGLTLRW